ncbi:MAG: prepilin-type N-terminal cleavage/methylation domain-containing protein [Deltaproteobacteria bacterium]|nr:prepilin-type N-terminal cleavage/methylation domain-containing protein [Deltaproteobacteria bacterium]
MEKEKRKAAQTGLTRPKGRSGFTLLELMVVVSTVAVMMMIGIPMVNSWLPDYHLRSAAREIGSAFQNARLRATSTSSEYRVAINTSVVPYSYQIEQGNQPSGSTAWTLDTGSYGELASDVLLGAVTPATTTGTFTLTRPSGAASTVTGNIIVFEPNSSTPVGSLFKIQLTNARNTRYQVSVSNTTGRVKVDNLWN